MEEGVILSPFALGPTKSHNLHCKVTARPCSPRALDSPSLGQAHGMAQEHDSLCGAFPSWVSATVLG